jgi:hypothetical protein
MAISLNQGGTTPPGTGPVGINNSVFNQLDPTKYTSLFDFIDEVNAPDVRANLIKTFGDQGITGFLKLTGAVNNAGTADEVTYWEEARLHQRQTGLVKTTVAATGKSFVIDGVHAHGGTGYDTQTEDGTVKALVAREGDILLVNGSDRCIVTTVTINATTGATEITLHTLSNSGLSVGVTADAAVDLPIVGNMFEQGSDQPGRFLESNVVKRTNPYSIIKETYKVSGSQATNIGYVDLGNGDYRWYIKGEQDTRQRFMDKREMTLLLGEKATTDQAAVTVSGSEGYFAALENRGLVTSGQIGSGSVENFGDIDAIITQLDKQGAPSEYAIYANTGQMLLLDNMLANGGTASTSGLSVNYGAFNNDKDMAVNLGFQSFARGGYTFHKHSWKLLNDPTLLDGSDYKGVMIPLANVVDAKTGNRAPALEMNYKAAGGYSREMEHWVTGGGVLGFTTDTKDVAQFNYRSECNLITRAANQHVLIK